MQKILRNFFSILLLFSFLFPLQAEIPTGYYEKAIGKSGPALKSALSSIVSNCGVISYKGLNSVYKTTDITSEGYVWDMYSSITKYSFSETCGNYQSEGDCWNREHSVPQSWFGSASPMVSDAWHVYPTDGKINGMRSNYPFGEVGTVDKSSSGNFSKLGSCVSPGYKGTVFEPNDEYKGDFARSYFFMATRYESRCGGWGGIFTSSYPHLATWVKDLMLKWHRNDQIGQKEQDRNDAVFASQQNNRNPFIDYPELVEYIWGDRQGEPFFPNGGDLPYIVEPVNNSTFDLGTVLTTSASSSVSRSLTIQGKNIEGDVNLTLSGGNVGLFGLSVNKFSAAQVNEGCSVKVTYGTTLIGAHGTTLVLSGGGLTSDVKIKLTGNAIDEFAAVAATDVTDKSFVANWAQKNGATNYEVAAYYFDKSQSSEEKTILTEDFQTKKDTWEYQGYTAPENGFVRLASSSQSGTAITPEMDLTGNDVSLYIKSKPYNEDKSTLYIKLDGKDIEAITYAGGSIEKTIPITLGTAKSKITFQANPKARVYLENLIITKGGGYKATNVSGFPKMAGASTSIIVDNLEPSTEYFYSVTPIVNEVKGSVSNEVAVTTRENGSLSMEQSPVDDIRVFVDGNQMLQVINASANAAMQLYSIDGRLIASYTLHDEFEEFPVNRSGVFIVRIVSAGMTSCKKILIP